MKIILVIIYNHNYELNVERLEKLYASRFHKIYHLMPFYMGNKENVIKIYGTSYLFQDYIRQGFTSYKDDKATHYCFMADDIFLNTKFNENNLIDKIGMDNNTAYISDMQSLSYDLFKSWPWAISVYRSLLDNPACEYENFLPSYDNAMSCFEKHKIAPPLITKEGFTQFKKFLGINMNNYYCSDFYPIFHSQADEIITKIKNDFQTRNYVYPLVRGYSDFFIIPQKMLEDFTHILGMFAAMNVFAEVAIPTAMVLCADKIITNNDITLKSHIIWDNKKSYEFRRSHEASLKKLASSCADDDFIFHPVKLSKWKD